MKATSLTRGQLRASSRSYDNEEDNHGDNIANQGKSTKKRKGLPVDDDDEITDMDVDIPSLLILVKAQGKDIAELQKTVMQLKETVVQLNLNVDKKNKMIEVIKECMKSTFLSWESFWKENEEGELDGKNPKASTSGQGCSLNGRGRGRLRRNRCRVTTKDVSKPRKRGRSSEQSSNLLKLAKTIYFTSDESEGEGNAVLNHEEKSSSSASILSLPDSEDDVETDDEVKDSSFVPSKIKQTVKNLNSKLRKARLMQKYRCEHCGKLYTTRGILKTHIQSVHEDIRFKCPHCPGTFAQFAQLEVHKKLHKKGGPRLEKCRVCGMELNGKKGVMILMAAVHKIYAGTPESMEVTEQIGVPVKCPLCATAFRQKDILRYHLSKNHGINGIEAETILEKCSTKDDERKCANTCDDAA